MGPLGPSAKPVGSGKQESSVTQKSVSEVEFQRDGEPGSNLSPRAAR